MHKKGSADSVLHISIDEFEASIHSFELTCQECHIGVEDENHETMKGSGAVDCGECHEQENRHGLQAKSENRTQCYSCHTKHGTLGRDNEDSSVHPDRLKETCKGCHPVECGGTNYLSWLPSLRIASHNKQDFGRAYVKDNCLGCHQGETFHGDKEPINDQICYKCHLPLKGQAILWGYFHPKVDFEKQPAIFTAAIVYQILIVFLCWGGFRFYLKKIF
tara:strand:- start:1 stop:657 length:657 start_codon:yes stop_codon:yes gene_type:complete